MSRQIIQSVLSIQESESEDVGSSLRRSIGRSELKYLDPFLLVDEFTVRKPAGYPDHPHRGYETVTFIFSGVFYHEDFFGRTSNIYPGDFQWMTAGRGLVHAKMPASDELGSGLQIWINLSKEYKMCEPSCQELKREQIPTASKDGVHVAVVAGESLGKKANIKARTPTMILEFKIDNGAKFSQPIPEGWNGFCYVLSGNAYFGPPNAQTKGEPSNALILGQGNAIEFENKESESCHFYLVAGQPLKEPLAQCGQFVMNTDEEVQQAISDFKNAKNGFENARNWRSKIAIKS